MTHALIPVLMTHAVRALLEGQAELLFQGRPREMLPRYDLPLAVQVGEEMSVLSTQEQFVATMTKHRGRLIASGVTGLAARLTAVELPRRGRFRLWADFDHLRPGSTERGADQMIVYCRHDMSGIRVELLHCTRLALTAAAPQRSARLA